MRKNRKPTKNQESIEQQPKKTSGSFHFEFLNNQQRNAWQTIEENDITFLIGPAGCAKSFLSSAYACSSILTKKSKKIYITRPIVEAGSEKLGYLPGTFEEKTGPYFTPIFDALDELVGPVGFQREIVAKTLEISYNPKNLNEIKLPEIPNTTLAFIFLGIAIVIIGAAYYSHYLAQNSSIMATTQGISSVASVFGFNNKRY